MKPLRPMERAFVLAYVGAARANGTKAAILAGYAPKSARVQASQLLTRPNIRAAVDKLTKAKEGKSIADAIERDEKLTDILRTTTEENSVRIAAIKELNKVEGRHIYRHQVTGRITLEQALGASHDVGNERVTIQATRELARLADDGGPADE